MPRPPSAASILRNIKKNKRKFEPKTPIATDMFIPNHSGDLSAGKIRTDPTLELNPVNKKYVDNIATRGAIDLFLTENASDIATYFDLEVDVVTAAEENIVQSIIANSTTLIASFATILNEAEIDRITLLENGIYGLHIHAKGEAARSQFLTIYCEFYHRTALGVETLLGTTHDSEGMASSETEYNVHASITNDTAFVVGDRIVMKVYGRNTSSPARNITIYIEGDTASRAEIPAFISQGAGGNVNADANLTDEKIVQGDGGAKGVKTSTATVAQIATNVTHSGGDGSDHADVASNTTHRNDNSQAHTDYMLNSGDTGVGNYTFDGLFRLSSENLVVSAGEITISKSHVTVDTEDSDPTDELDTINGGSGNHILIVRSANGARDTTLIDGSGNLRLAGNVNFRLANIYQTIMLMKIGTSWVELSRSAN